MDAESFAAVSEEVKLCVAQAHAVSLLLARQRDVSELCAKLRKLWESAEPALRPYLQLCTENSEGAVDIGWPYTWGSAHEAGLGIAYFMMLGESTDPRQTTDFTLNQKAMGLLTTRLEIERAKVLAALGTGETQHAPPVPEVPAPRLRIELAKLQLTLDGSTHDVKSEHALRWIQVLVDNEGKWIPGGDLEKFDIELVNKRTDKLRPFLPKSILSLIDSETGRGSRIRLT